MSAAPHAVLALVAAGALGLFALFAAQIAEEKEGAAVGCAHLLAVILLTLALLAARYL